MNDNAALITQMRKGAIEYCVLALLVDRARYGYEIVQALSAVDGMLVTEGTIYPILARQKREGLIDAEWRESREGPPRKYYRLTPAGHSALAEFAAQWRVFSRAVDHFVRNVGGANGGFGGANDDADANLENGGEL